MNSQKRSELGRRIAAARILTPDCINALTAFESDWIPGALGNRMFALLLGESGTGKTEVAKMMQARFKANRDTSGITRRSLSIELPTSPTAIAFLETVLKGLGDPHPLHGTRSAKFQRVLHLLDEERVLILLIDEFQHFLDKDQDRVIFDASECLKSVWNHSNVSVIGVGLDDSTKVIESNEQLMRRSFPPAHMRRFDWSIESSRNAFAGLLRAFQKELDAFKLPDLTSDELALRMFLASGGLIDYVSKILLNALAQALDSDSVKITTGMLASARSRVIWQAGTSGQNPLDIRFRLPEDLGDAIRKAKNINARVARPKCKRRGVSSLTEVGL